MTYAYRVRGVVPDGVRAALDDRYGPNGWTQEWDGYRRLYAKDNPAWLAEQSLISQGVINQGVIPKPEPTKQGTPEEIPFTVNSVIGEGIGNLTAVNHLVFR